MMMRTITFLLACLFSLNIALGAPAPKLNTQDTAMLLPAFNIDQIKSLLKLSSTPAQSGLDATMLPKERGLDQPILHRQTYDALVDNPSAKAVMARYGLLKPPAYDQWRIVSARFIPCVRPTENVSGSIVNVDQLSSGFTNERKFKICQLEHRLVAQPFDTKGQALPFSIHVINRPFRSGDIKSHQLSRVMLKDIFRLKKLAGFDKPENFNIYPNSDRPEILKEINHHIVRFYGGGFLRTLAFMGSNDAEDKFLFWSGSGKNPSASEAGTFSFSNLIRPDQAGFPKEKDAFQFMEVSGGNLSVLALDESGNILKPTPGNHIPSIYEFLENMESPSGQQMVLNVNNTRKFFLPDLDCTSCHGVTSHIISYSKPLAGIGFSADDPFITVEGDPKTVMQNEPRDFINLGYKSKDGNNFASIATVLINDAAMTSSFINKSQEFWLNENFDEWEKKIRAAEKFSLQTVDASRINDDIRTLVKKQFQMNPPRSLLLESGIRIENPNKPVFTLEGRELTDEQSILVDDAEAQIIGDFLGVTSTISIPHASRDDVHLFLQVNERDEAMIFVGIQTK